MKKFLSMSIYFVGFIFIFSCSTPTDKKSNPNYLNGEVYETKTGVEFILYENQTNKAEKPDIVVKLNGFTETNEGFTFKFSDPIEEAFLMDLDSNGYEELYIITKAINKTSTASIYGMASNVDKSASKIFTPDVSFRSQSKTSFFRGFGGNNSFFIKNGQIFEKYPMNNLKNSLGQKIIEGEIQYALELYDGKWSLSPIGQVNKKA